jgi:hypothetical protein
MLPHEMSEEQELIVTIALLFTAMCNKVIPVGHSLPVKSSAIADLRLVHHLLLHRVKSYFQVEQMFIGRKELKVCTLYLRYLFRFASQFFVLE